MRYPLLWKLLAVNIPIVMTVIVLVWIAVDYLAADYFMVLMDEYHISPRESHDMFVSAIHRYLIGASLLAIVIALVAGYLLNRRVLDPLLQMIEVTDRISAGDYRNHVQVHGQDEIAQLGRAFNRMTDSLLRNEQLRKNMVSDIAHELRTPLTNVRGYLEGIHDGVIDPDHAAFELLQAEVGRLTGLVDSLSRLTRAEAAELSMQKEKVSLDGSLNRVLSFFTHLLKTSHIDLKVQVDSGADTVNADGDQLHQVLQNLVQNAVQYTPEGGTILIHSAPAVEGVRVTVSNPGDPIPEASLPLIFERFYRVDGSRSRDSGGAGIGLSIVRKLVEAHGGRVGAYTAGNVNHIWFELPA